MNVYCRRLIEKFYRDVVEAWLPAWGSGHVAYYASFREALDGFRDALQVGRFGVLL